MTLNDLEHPKNVFIVNFPQFLAAVHISTVNCDEMACTVFLLLDNSLFVCLPQT